MLSGNHAEEARLIFHDDVVNYLERNSTETKWFHTAVAMYR